MLRRTLSVKPKVMKSSFKSNISKEDLDVDNEIKKEETKALTEKVVPTEPVKKKIRFGKSSEKDDLQEDDVSENNLLVGGDNKNIESEKKEIKNDYARPSFKGSSSSNDSPKNSYYKNSLSKKISNIASRDIEEYEW